MANVIFSMSVSLDGYIAGPDGNFDFTAPDEELHRFHNDQVRELSAHLLGRRLYETMLYWETADQTPGAPDVIVDFARIWQALPRVVFSTTLDRVEGNARLATGDVEDELAKVLEDGDGGDVAIGGAGLAAAAFERGLI